MKLEQGLKKTRTNTRKGQEGNIEGSNKFDLEGRDRRTQGNEARRLQGRKEEGKETQKWTRKYEKEEVCRE